MALSSGFFRPAQADDGMERARASSTGLESTPAGLNEPHTSDSSNSSAAAPLGLPGHLDAAPRDGANIRYACFAVADLALPAMSVWLGFALP